MARMFPERLPDNLPSDAEYALFAAFERELDDQYAVFASVRWLLKGGRSGAREGEADFVIAHPTRGLLVIEAKGGDILRDGQLAAWRSRDRFGDAHEIKDPIVQARNNAHRLDDKLRESPSTQRFDYHIAHAVAFPDIRLKHTSLGLDAPEQIVIDADDFGRMQAAIERVHAFAFGDRDTAIGAAGIRALTEVISPSWEIQTSMLARLRSDREQFMRLTEQQYFVLDMLGGHRQALVDGCAGSGKTMLAVEKARRLASEGFNTLLTCFNKNLAAAIRDSFGPLPANLRIQHFHELADQLVEHAGIEKPTVSGDLNHYFSVTLPTLLIEAIDQLDIRFDAIIVDEGQDFQAEWWIPLMGLLRQPDDVFYVFYDGCQSIYTSGPSLPLTSEPHFLPVNLRNTQAIHRTIAQHYQTRPVSCRGPEGREPTHIFATDPTDALRKELHRLVHDEGIATADIVVLSAASERRSRWAEGQKVGNLTLTWQPGRSGSAIRVSTIHSFKGLERPVVIVTELEEASSGARIEQLRLVAYSRASSELITIAQA